jgi:hypothetical protein
VTRQALKLTLHSGDTKAGDAAYKQRKTLFRGGTNHQILAGLQFCQPPLRSLVQTTRPVAYPGICSRGGGGGGGLRQEFFRGAQQIQLRTEGRENGDLGAIAPWSGVPFNLQMSETRILIRLLRMCFLRNWEFCSALSKLRNFGGNEHPKPPSPSVRHCTRQYVPVTSYTVRRMSKINKQRHYKGGFTHTMLLPCRFPAMPFR